MKKHGILPAWGAIRVAFPNSWLKRKAYIFSFVSNARQTLCLLIVRHFYLHISSHFFRSCFFCDRSIQSLSSLSYLISGPFQIYHLCLKISVAICPYIFLFISLIKKKGNALEARSAIVTVYEHPYLFIAISQQGRTVGCKTRFAEVVIAGHPPVISPSRRTLPHRPLLRWRSFPVCFYVSREYNCIRVWH